jgi:hypothetical protein
MELSTTDSNISTPSPHQANTSIPPPLFNASIHMPQNRNASDQPALKM